MDGNGGNRPVERARTSDVATDQSSFVCSGAEVASRDPNINRLSGRVAALSRVAGGPPRVAAPDSIIPDDERASYLAEVDPGGTLPLRERQRRAAAAWRRDQAAEALRAYKAGTGRPGGDAA